MYLPILINKGKRMNSHVLVGAGTDAAFHYADSYVRTDVSPHEALLPDSFADIHPLRTPGIPPSSATVSSMALLLLPHAENGSLNLRRIRPDRPPPRRSPRTGRPRPRHADTSPPAGQHPGLGMNFALYFALSILLVAGRHDHDIPLPTPNDRDLAIRPGSHSVPRRQLDRGARHAELQHPVRSAVLFQISPGPVLLPYDSPTVVFRISVRPCPRIVLSAHQHRRIAVAQETESCESA